MKPIMQGFEMSFTSFASWNTPQSVCNTPQSATVMRRCWNRSPFE